METTVKQNKKTTVRANGTAKKKVQKEPTGNPVDLKVEHLDMDKMVPDPLQPRKTFKKEALKGLSESIAEHGVLQPITVRKSGKGYVVVMGERRYRASKLAGKKTIPAIIREYDNNDVLEVQIIENLQRQDVEPTEEAEAIEFLSKKYASTEIAKRLGRGDNFVRQRLKLAGLIEGFKHFVRSGEMTISLGVGVALFEPEEQQMMLDALEGEFNANQIKRMIDNQTYTLDKAPFDLEDKKLIARAGACTLCPFNAANQGNLFGDGKMVCTKSTCFESKKLKSFFNLIERVKKENVLLIPDIRTYWADDESNQLIISQMEKQGLTVHLFDDVDIIEQPVQPTTASVKEEYFDEEATEKDIQEELDEALETYNEELQEYNKAQENGFVKGILFYRNSYAHIEVFVKIKEASDSKPDARSLPLEKRKMEDCTPEEQITKINDKEIRKKDIENNKQFEEVVKMVRESNYVDTKKTLSTDEMVAFSISLYENNLHYVDRQKLFKDFYGNTSKKSRSEQVEQFKKNFKKETFHKLIRYVLTRQVHFGEVNHINDMTNISFYAALQGHCKAKIAKIEELYTEKRNIREKRLKERIAALEKQVKALSA